MPEQNVELHRRFYEVFNERDKEALIALCDPQIEFHSVFAPVTGGVHRGHDGMRDFLQGYDDVFGQDVRVDVEALFDLGSKTLAYFTLRGRGRQSGVETSTPISQLARWRDGLIVFLKSYATKEDALKELGMSEAALQEFAA